jgi:hypothetical protein
VHEPIDRATLRFILAHQFSESDLQDLCFDLDAIEYENLPGKSKRDKARELVLRAQKQDFLLKLVDFGKQIRQDIDWENIFVTQESEEE